MGGEKNSGALWMARHVALCTIIVITSRRGIFTTIMQHSAMWIILQLIHGSICLGDKFFRVGFTRNSGGWKGAYSAEGSFSLTGWGGPTIDFFEKAALEANFNMKASTFPEHLREESVAFFSTSSFDRCVYATSLGYLDFCVGRYTMTNKRASAATFFTLFSKPLYLVVFMEEKGSMTAF